MPFFLTYLLAKLSCVIYPRPVYLLAVTSLLMLLTTCRQPDRLPISESPRGIYQQKMMDTPLGEKEMAGNWVAVADTALERPTDIDTPFQTKSIYFNDEVYAWGWTFSSTEGRIIQAALDAADSTHNVFMDLFALKNNDTLLVASTKDSLLTHKVEESGSFILRLQPELLISGSFILKVTDRPSMVFPVSGAKRYDIGGKWGDPRDGGSRSHRGIDIFADRNTPAIAAADGQISKAGHNARGGNIIWLNTHRRSLYYAHLDTILVNRGEQVQTGDTLGLVGTSGNAQSTPPHLHFGIYGPRSPVNPLPFIADADDDLKPVDANPAFFDKWGRLQTGPVNLRPTPSTQRQNIATLKRHEAVKILGGVEKWYQVQLPDGQSGFVNGDFLELPSRINSIETDSQVALYNNYDDSQPSFRTDSTYKFDLFATFNNHSLTQYRTKWVWIK